MTPKSRSIHSPSSGWTQRRSSSKTALQSSHPPSGASFDLTMGGVPPMGTSITPKGVRYISSILAGSLLITLINTIFLSTRLDFQTIAFKNRLSLLPHDQKRRRDSTFIQPKAEPERFILGPNNNRHFNTNPFQTIQNSIRKAQAVIAQNLSLQGTEQDISTRIIPCTKDNCQSLLDKDPNTKIVYYNPQEQTRYICGMSIQSNSLLVFNQTHQDPCPQHYSQPLATLFPVLPTLANHRNSSLIPPIQIGIKGMRPTRFDKFYKFRGDCDVKVEFLQSNLKALSIVKTIIGTDWEIAVSMENYNILNNNEYRYFYSTTSLDSDIPIPYFSWTEYAPDQKAAVPGVDYDQAIHGAVFMAKNCHSKNNREALVQGLMELSRQNNASLRIDSVSKCLHNHDPPPTQTPDDKNEIMSQYLFYLAFENENAKDYITEKLWGSLFQSRAVPVYVGAANVHEHVPPHSVINVRDFPNLNAVWNYLVQAAQNRTLYESYHAWRQQPLPNAFVRKYNFTHTHSICRTGRWAFAKLYGLGWDHVAQTIEEEEIGRKRQLCWSDVDGLLFSPFRERWFTSALHGLQARKDHDMVLCTDENQGGCAQSMNGDTTCYRPGNQHQNQTQSIMIGSMRRTIWSHDGLVDLWLQHTTSECKDQSVLLEMDMPFMAGKSEDTLNWERASHWEFWVQRGKWRMTILTSQRVFVTSPRDGTLEIFISVPGCTGNADSTFRMRTIVEEVDDTRRSGKVKSYYAGIAAGDFFQPLQKMLVLREGSPLLVSARRDLLQFNP